MSEDLFAYFAKVEQEQGFNREAAEKALGEFLQKRIHGPVTFLPPYYPGVLAFHRLTPDAERSFGWDEVAACVARTVNLDVLTVFPVDWMPDSDELNTPVTCVCCNIPALMAAFRYRPDSNLITPVLATAVPSEEDFERRNEAQNFVSHHRFELHTRLRGVEGPEHEQTELALRFLEQITFNIKAEDRALVQALLDHDLEAAMATKSGPADEALPTP